MPDIKITPQEIKKIVRDANKELFEDRVSALTDPEAFTQSYPANADQGVAARKQQLLTYEKYVNTCNQSLKFMIDQVNADFKSGNLQKADVEYLISDQLGRLRNAVSYAESSLQAIVENDGLKQHGAGPQFPYMMEEKLK